MRTLKYIIIGLAICSTFSLSAQNKTELYQIILKAFDQNKSSQDLAAAANVLQKRLEIFGINKLTMDVQGKEPKIVIQYQKDVHPQELEHLLTATGKLEFCQTFEKQEVAAYFKNPTIVDLLGLQNTPENAALIGKVDEKQSGKVNDYLNQLEKSGDLPANLKFAWSKKVDSKGQLSLFALKYSQSGKPLVDGDHLSLASWETNDQTQEHLINLSFDEKGKQSIADATQANIGNVIAIVIDQEVYLAPKIASAITGGKLQITGDFSKQESAVLASVLGGKSLPFKLHMD